MLGICRMSALSIFYAAGTEPCITRRPEGDGSTSAAVFGRFYHHLIPINRNNLMKHLTAVVVALMLSVGAAKAQGITVELGPKVGFDVAGDIEELFVGADARFRTSLPVVLNAAFDYYFTESELTVWQLGLNALYEFGIDNEVFTPYAGAGLGITRFSVDIDTPIGDFNSSSTEAGINLIGGARMEMGTVGLFGQAQLTFGDPDIIGLAAGVLFSLGGN